MDLFNALSNARMGYQTPGDTETLRRAPGNLVKGQAAAFAGMPADVSDLFKALMQAKQGYVAPQEPSKYGTEGLGRAMGADTDSGAFLLGNIGVPDITDILKVAGPAAIMGGIHGVNKLMGLKQADNGGELMGALMSRAAPGADVSMTAYHGTPHKFDKFQMDKIGTGEGAQAYGHGLYFAEEPGVAGEYRKLFQRRAQTNPTTNVQHWDSLMRIAGKHKIKIENPGHKSSSRIAEILSSHKDVLSKTDMEAVDAAIGGHLYEVDIPDEQIDRMLDWDKPLSEQPESVRKALGGIYDENMTGEQLYKQMAMDSRDAQIARLDDYNNRMSELSRIMDEDSAGGYRNFKSEKGRKAAEQYDALMQQKGMSISPQSTTMEGMQAAVSNDLNALGIPGIKYLDGTSRSAGEGTRNFVVFDENLVKVLKRNGEALE